MAVAERELAVTPNPWRCTREQFYRMGDMGLFEGQYVLLIEGEILTMPPMGNLHRSVVALTSDALQKAFGGSFFVSVQSPFDIGQATDPEPDIAIISGAVRDYLDRGLTEAALIVEVSDATLGYDRHEKAALYARAGIADYWVINLKQFQIEVHRQSSQLTTGLFGYGEVTIYQRGQTITPLAAPNASVIVADLLP